MGVRESLSPIIGIPAGIILLVLTGMMFRSIWQYLAAIRELALVIKEGYPDIWHTLGEPKWVHVREPGSGTDFLQPALALVTWLLRNDPTGLNHAHTELYRQTRMLFVRSLQYLLASGSLIVLLYFISP